MEQIVGTGRGRTLEVDDHTFLSGVETNLGSIALSIGCEQKVLSRTPKTLEKVGIVYGAAPREIRENRH